LVFIAASRVVKKRRFLNLTITAFKRAETVKNDSYMEPGPLVTCHGYLLAMDSDKTQSTGQYSAAGSSAKAPTITDAAAAADAIPGEGKFRLAFEKAPFGMAIIDLNYKPQRVNNALCLALGYSEEELLAHDFGAITHPDDINKDRKLANELLSGKIPSYRVEKRFVTKEGGLAWLDITLLLIRDEENKPQYVLAMGENISGRKRTHEALRTSEERYRSFVVNSSEAIWRFEIERPIDITLPVDEQIALFYKHAYLAECNDSMARMYGNERADDIVGSRFGEFALASNPTNISALRKFISSGYRMHEVESTDLAVDGSRRYIVNNVIGIVINGQLLRIWGTQRDETERRRAEEELKTSHAQLRSLAGRLQSVREQERTNIAREMHDVLGQSLTSLKLDLSRLKKKLIKTDGEPVDPALEERVSEMILELDNTITAVKTLSTDLRPGILDKLGLAAAVEWQCQDFAIRTGISCSCEVPDQKISISDERSTALFRILQEALANVVRHADATSVKVNLHLGKSLLRLSVSDNGRGITTGELFDPTSLGLLGMRERAEMLGGHFKVAGKSSLGTTVIAEVPLAEAAPVKAVETSDGQSTASRRPSGGAQRS